jgi:4'-phosphopantetheinyl transferase
MSIMNLGVPIGLGLMGKRFPAPFGLWLIDVPEVLDPRLPACLSDQENARADRFREEFFARRYRAAHGALRLLADSLFGIPAGHQHYETNAYGKPGLRDFPSLHCSLSYGGSRVLVGWSQDRAIGVDLEPMRTIPEARDLAELYFTPAESSSLSRAEDMDRAFLTAWVRKESCVKALGSGLTIAPASFECDVDPGSVLVEIEGSSIESHVYDLKDDDLVAWARCIPPNRCDRIHRHVAACHLPARVSTAEVAAVPRG